jgi:hypothetical protein
MSGLLSFPVLWDDVCPLSRVRHVVLHHNLGIRQDRTNGLLTIGLLVPVVVHATRAPTVHKTKKQKKAALYQGCLYQGSLVEPTGPKNEMY